VSSDNGLLLKRTTDGWELREYCASYEEPWDRLKHRGTFETPLAALIASQGIYTEYGVSYVEEDEE
jgi:hypothetical protein